MYKITFYTAFLIVSFDVVHLDLLIKKNEHG